MLTRTSIDVYFGGQIDRAKVDIKNSEINVCSVIPSDSGDVDICDKVEGLSHVDLKSFQGEVDPGSTSGV